MSLKALALSLTVFAVGCGGITTLETTVSGLLEEADVMAKTNVCELPPGTPIAANYVLLGCRDGKIPVLLDTHCQKTSPSAKSCAYAVDAFADLAKADPKDQRLLQP